MSTREDSQLKLESVASGGVGNNSQQEKMEDFNTGQGGDLKNECPCI